MKSIPIILSLFLSISLSVFSQDSTIVTALYGEEISGVADSSFTFYSIDVDVKQIDTLNFKSIHAELIDIQSGQVMTRRVVGKNDEVQGYTLKEDELELSLGNLPKSNYRILVRLTFYNGTESQLYQIELNEE